MTTKKCRECGEAKNLSDDFYKSNKSYCKECIKARTRKNRAAKLEHYQEYDRQRDGLPHRVAARKVYAKTEAYRISTNRCRKKWQALNPHKRAASTAVNNAIRLGKLSKSKACESCGQTGRIEGHHDDYTKPLEVRWLCPQCHASWHKHNTPIEA